MDLESDLDCVSVRLTLRSGSSIPAPPSGIDTTCKSKEGCQSPGLRTLVLPGILRVSPRTDMNHAT